MPETNAKQTVSPRSLARQMTAPILCALASIALGITAAHAGSHSGIARVVDGDSLWIGKQEYRLFGIDAVELNQDCKLVDTVWTCGQEAKRVLTEFVSGKQVTCRWQEYDRYDRRLGTCSVNGIDLGSLMVLRGYAVAYRRYSTRYVPAEIEARNERRGIWRGTFDAPEEYRVRGRGIAAPPPDESRLIKGNINRQGVRYFHCPEDRSYDNTRITEAKGERWFSSREEAEAAGWRRPPGAQECKAQ